MINQKDNLIALVKSVFQCQVLNYITLLNINLRKTTFPRLKTYLLFKHGSTFLHRLCVTLALQISLHYRK
jgi:hypothetical protein